MKKQFFTTLCAVGLVLASASFNINQVKAQSFVRDVKYAIEFLGSGFWIVATCLEDPGDKCDTVGAKFRERPIDLMSLFGLLRRF